MLWRVRETAGRYGLADDGEYTFEQSAVPFLFSRTSLIVRLCSQPVRRQLMQAHEVGHTEAARLVELRSWHDEPTARSGLIIVAAGARLNIRRATPARAHE